MNANSDAAARGTDEVCSVLVPVLNEERHIEASLAAMRRQRFHGRLEFLVADGGSEDRTRAILARLAHEDDRIRLLDNPRRTTPSGLNVALAHSTGQWACRMDAHTEYPDNYVELGVRRLAQGDTRWVSGPPIATGNGPVSRAVSLALRTPLGRGGSRKWAAEPGPEGAEYELDSGVFAGVWERRTLLEYGGWDEQWARNQDSEMAGRFLARGEKLICLPAMASRYVPRDTVAGLFKQYYEYGEFRTWTARRHPHTMRRSHLLPPALVACLACVVAAPAPVRRVARLGATLYLGALLVAGLKAVQVAEMRRDAALVPAVLATMHVAHGAGAYRAAVRRGPPLAALTRVLGFPRLATRLTPPPEPVFAPSLQPERSSTARTSS